MMNKICDKYLLTHPFTSIVAGPSKSGKTRLVLSIVSSINDYVYPKIEKIYYCYSEWQPIFDELENIEFVQGLLDTESLCSSISKLVIIDDLMEEGMQSRTVVDFG